MESYFKIKRFAKMAECDFYINEETVVLRGNVRLSGKHFSQSKERWG